MDIPGTDLVKNQVCFSADTASKDSHDAGAAKIISGRLPKQERERTFDCFVRNCYCPDLAHAYPRQSAIKPDGGFCSRLTKQRMVSKLISMDRPKRRPSPCFRLINLLVSSLST